MRTRDYITASAQLIESGTDIETVLSGLKRTLTRRGHERLLPRVLSGLRAHLDAHTIDDAYTVVVAREKDRETFSQEIDAMRGEKEVHATHVDDRIVGGYILEGKDTIIDASYKTALRALYNRIIT